MYVLRLKSIRGRYNFEASGPPSQPSSNLKADQHRAVNEGLKGTRPFDAPLMDDPKTAIEWGADRREQLARIRPRQRPMTEAQALAWLADFGL
jgi:hypothetical protein